MKNKTINYEKTQRIKFAHIYVIVFSLAETELSFCFFFFSWQRKRRDKQWKNKKREEKKSKIRMQGNNEETNAKKTWNTHCWFDCLEAGCFFDLHREGNYLGFSLLVLL